MSVGIAIKRHRLARNLSLKAVEYKSGLWARVITSVESGEHQPTRDTLECLDRVLNFDEPLRSILFSSVRPLLWFPGDLALGDDPKSLTFRSIYYRSLMEVGQRATLIRYCAPALATALSPPDVLSRAVAAKFGRSRQAKELALQMVRRSVSDCERIRRGQAKAEVLCLLDETRDHLRANDADRLEFIDHICETGNVELRIVTTRPSDSELRVLSFAMMQQAGAGACVCITDQSLPGQLGRDSWIDTDRSDRFKLSESIYLAYWNDPHTYRIDPPDLRGL